MQHMLLLLVGLVSTISVKAADYDFKAESTRIINNVVKGDDNSKYTDRIAFGLKGQVRSCKYSSLTKGLGLTLIETLEAHVLGFKPSGEIRNIDVTRDEEGRLQYLSINLLFLQEFYIYYDDEGRIESIQCISTIKKENGKKETIIEEDEYFYDDKGRIRHVINLNGDNIKFNYTKYDAQGNWIERIITCDDKQTKQTRTINYY